MREDSSRLSPLWMYLACLAALLGLALSIVKRELLPDEFFFDEARILLFIAEPGLIVRDGSYAGTTAIYLLLGGYWLSTAAMSALTFGIFIVLLQRHLPLRVAASSFRLLIFYGATVCLAGIYVAGYTKEAVLVVLMLLFPSAKQSMRAEVIWCVALLAYGASVRSYWLIVIAIYIVLRVSLRVWSPVRVLVVLTPILFVGLSVAFRSVLGVDLHHFRNIVLEGLAVLPGSAIEIPLAPTSVVNDVVNAFWSVLVLVLPYPLLGSGLSQLPAAIYIGGFWCLLISRIRVGSAVRSTDHSRRWSLAFAYLIVLSLFEPDYGSYLRHLVAVVPVLLPMIQRPFGVDPLLSSQVAGETGEIGNVPR